jgi:protein-L-isoaspartate(D-aspartate) O-methyltransferase
MSHPLVAAAVGAGVRDAQVLEALAAVPRTRYVPQGFEAAADRDRPIRIGGGQVTTQPSLVAMIVEALELTGAERVLEIGTGLGYQSAILGRLCAGVWSVERLPELAAAAAANLAGAGNVHVVAGDGSEGLAEPAPFDAIVVAAAHPRVSVPLAGQLTEGGRLVQPIGPSGREAVTLFRRRSGALVRDRILVRASFVPLCGRHGFDDAT